VLTKTFEGISRDAFERMKADLRKLGVSVPDGDQFELHHQGVTGSLAYSEPEQRVEVRITRKPFFVSSAAVTSMLHKVMKRYSGPTGGEEA
jgi:hypothetical protein